MKMRVYGFSWHPDHLPTAVAASTVFERIEQVSGKEFGDYLAAVTKVGTWWAGVLLKIRDAKLFTKMRRENGVIIVSTEKLEEGERLAETNFFIGHETNGHGLYCHHHLSASLLGDFGYYCGHRFREIRKAKMQKAISAPGLSASKVRKLRKQFNGRLMIEQIVKPGTFDAHIRALKLIKSVDANLATFEVKETTFKPIAKLARRKKISFGYDSNVPVSVLADAVSKSREQGMIEKATVVGEDNSGHEQIFKTFHDSEVFEEYDYDEVVQSLTLRFDDLAGSIKNSELTKRLISIGDDPKVKKMLGI
jgi:hypothetical protein